MIAIKPGVRVEGLRPEIMLAVISANEWFGGRRMTITSGTEGRHGERSKHYIGQAVDIRTKDLTSGEEWELREWLSNLGEDYDIVQESDHLHVEFDPK
jgi:hypothetical protein